VGVRPVLQIYGRGDVLGSTYGAFPFFSPLLQATNGRHVDVLVRRAHRGSVPASTHRVGRCISEGRIQFGRWTALRKRCVRLGIVIFLFSLQESSYIARISHYLESCLLTSRRFFLTVTIVSACVPVGRQTLLIYPTVLFYIFTDADSQRDHVLGFFSKVSLDLLVRVPNLTF
jgi:hypothetical protein